MAGVVEVVIGEMCLDPQQIPQLGLEVGEQRRVVIDRHGVVVLLRTGVQRAVRRTPPAHVAPQLAFRVSRRFEEKQLGVQIRTGAGRDRAVSMRGVRERPAAPSMVWPQPRRCRTREGHRDGVGVVRVVVHDEHRTAAIVGPDQGVADEYQVEAEERAVNGGSDRGAVDHRRQAALDGVVDTARRRIGIVGLDERPYRKEAHVDPVQLTTLRRTTN
jgi:hypothetical protein